MSLRSIHSRFRTTNASVNNTPGVGAVPRVGRRAWLGQCAAWAAVPLAATAEAATAGDRSATVDTGPATPDEALEKLYAGNRRFVAGMPTEAHRDIDRVKQVAGRQTPFAAFLGCADSRVPIEIVFDQGFGDLFVTRIAGNVATNENIGSLEFGTLVLGAKVLYVLGHTNCGAINAAIQGEEVPGQISGLFQHLRPSVRVARGNVAVAVEDNVRQQALTLAEASPVIARLVKQGKLRVAGGVYDLTSGVVTPVNIES